MTSVQQVYCKLLQNWVFSLLKSTLNHATDFLGVLTSSQATLNENGTVTVEFELKSCHKHFGAVWLVLDDQYATPIVYDSSNIRKTDSQPSSSVLQVPKDCLTKRGNVFSLNWPSPTARRSCSFPLIPLLECRVYSIEIIPIFQGFQGQSSTVTITVPPRVSAFHLVLFLCARHFKRIRFRYRTLETVRQYQICRLV